MLRKFDQPIYPIDLYVAIGDNLKEILLSFTAENGGELTDTEWNEADAFCFSRLINKFTNANCVLITFRKKVSAGIIAHEAKHATDRMFQHIDEKNMVSEPHAYLLEWIFNCCERTLNEYKE